jgi:hypothetical protein
MLRYALIADRSDEQPITRRRRRRQRRGFSCTKISMI